MTPLSSSDLDFLEWYAREATPGPRGCEAGEPVPGERFYVTGPAFSGDDPSGVVLMSADKHGDAVLAAFLTPERVLALVAMARQAPRWIPVSERLPDDPRPASDYVNVLMGWGGHVKKGRYQFGEDTGFYGEKTELDPQFPRFWMPLPEPPR